MLLIRVSDSHHMVKFGYVKSIIKFINAQKYFFYKFFSMINTSFSLESTDKNIFLNRKYILVFMSQ